MTSTRLHRLLGKALLDRALNVLDCDTTNMASDADERGNYPIHKLLSGKLVSWEKPLDDENQQFKDKLVQLLKRLVEACPESVKTKNNSGELPILMVQDMQGMHGAAGKSKFVVEILLVLAAAWPESLLLTRGRDYVTSPLKTVVLVCSYGGTVHEDRSWKKTLFEQMLDIYPQVLELDLKKPQSVLRDGCLSYLVLAALETRSPEVLLSTDPRNGNTVFHDFALTMDGYYEENKRFFQRHPEGLKVKNKSGELPISIAATRGNFSMEKAMAEAYPESLQAIGSYDPIVSAARPSKKIPCYTQRHLAYLHGIRAAANPTKGESPESDQLLMEANKLLEKQNEELRHALSVTRTNEQHLLKILVSGAQNPSVSIDHLKEVARSTLSRLVATGSSRSTAQIMLPSLLKDDEATKEDLIHVILSLDAELPNYEVDHTKQVSNGDKHNRSSNDSETASKRARVSV